MKQHLKCADEITKENLDNSANAAIIKSASTPASLQAVIRFQNGSNMSLQHKVSFQCKVFRRHKMNQPYSSLYPVNFRPLFQLKLKYGSHIISVTNAVKQRKLNLNAGFVEKLLNELFQRNFLTNSTLHLKSIRCNCFFFLINSLMYCSAFHYYFLSNFL